MGVSKSLCRQCRWHGYLATGGQHVGDGYVFCSYVTDAKAVPKGKIIEGEWHRSADGRHCPEFEPGIPKHRTLSAISEIENLSNNKFNSWELGK